MSDTPDLGRIVSLIMENPTLIEEISNLAKRDSEEATSVAESPVEEPASAPITDSPSPTVGRSRILHAMKPYLSPERQKAIDSMAAIAEMLTLMKRR